MGRYKLELKEENKSDTEQQDPSSAKLDGSASGIKEEPQDPSLTEQHRSTRRIKEEQQDPSLTEQHRSTRRIKEEQQDPSLTEQHRSTRRIKEEQQDPSLTEQHRSTRRIKEEQQDPSLTEQHRSTRRIKEEQQDPSLTEQHRSTRRIKEEQQDPSLTEQHRSTRRIKEEQQDPSLTEQHRSARRIKEEQQDPSLTEQHRSTRRIKEEQQDPSLTEQHRSTRRIKEEQQDPSLTEQHRSTRRIKEEQQDPSLTEQHRSARRIKEEQQDPSLTEQHRSARRIKEDQSLTEQDRNISDKSHYGVGINEHNRNQDHPIYDPTEPTDKQVSTAANQPDEVVVELMEECTRSDTDLSDEDLSDAESYVSVVDSGEDIIHDTQTEDSDPEWEPSTILAEVFSEKMLTTESDSEPESGPSAAKVPRMETRRGRGRARARGRGRAVCTRKTETPPTAERWYGVDHPDITPTQPTFRPSRNPGCQLITTANYSVLQLFQLFFTNSILLVLVQNTNEHGRATQNTAFHQWTDITLPDMFSFLSMVIYMGFVKATALTDYWRQGHLYSFGFPKSVISGRKFFSISCALYLSSAEEYKANEEKRGTTEYDRLGIIKPLYLEFRDACRRNYQPDQHISIDERMVASKAHVHFKQYMKNKPLRWGFKLFVLADSKSGYTWDFFVYQGKSTDSSDLGLSYDSVMKLIDTSLLGTGYKLYVDKFYTSPTLFQDLLKRKIWACGTVRTNRIGPKTTNNALDQKCSRGSVRWIREGSLLFVQWRDTRDISLCSTFHTAHGEETVKRKTRDDEGRWTIKDVPVPPAVVDYNKHIGGVALSDALIGYYNVLHKTKKWYKTFFYHFIDIAIVNAFIIHKDICKQKGQVPLRQKAFRETLARELAQVGAQQSSPQQEAGPKGDHRLVFISGDKTTGRLKCRKCHSKTAVKCGTCDIPLCFVPSRNCYDTWHVEKRM